MTSYILSRDNVQLVRFTATSDWSARNFALTAMAGDRNYDVVYQLHREEDFVSVPETEGINLATEEYNVFRDGNHVCGFRAAIMEEAVVIARAMVDAPYDAYRLHHQDDWFDLSGRKAGIDGR